MLSLLLFLLLVSEAVALSCKDQDNQDVDWFAVYKMPKEFGDNTVPGIQKGVAWYYLDSNRTGALMPSPKTLDDSDQAIAYTLNQFYANRSNPNIFHLMYNDEPYNRTSRTLADMLSSNKVRHMVEFGHTKGTIFFDDTSGVWLIHSVPKFPPPDHYEYPKSGHDYGQTMWCLSIPYSQLGNIGSAVENFLVDIVADQVSDMSCNTNLPRMCFKATQLYYNKPEIYSAQLPLKMASDHPMLSLVLAGKYKRGPPFTSTLTLTTMGGSNFLSFAKTNEFNNDLYDGLVAQHLMVDLTAETWRRGSEVPLNCGLTYHTTDALMIQVGVTRTFKYTKDHSKMARSTDSAKPWVCIGDINRMTSQYVRGGGTMCLSSSVLWEAFNVMKQAKQC